LLEVKEGVTVGVELVVGIPVTVVVILMDPVRLDVTVELCVFVAEGV